MYTPTYKQRIQLKKRERSFKAFERHTTVHKIAAAITRANTYSLRHLVNDLEPFSLLPKEEIAKIIQLANLFILLNLGAGKKVKMDNFGQYVTTSLASGITKDPVTGEYTRHVPRTTIGFKAAHFARWFFNPAQFTYLQHEKVPGFYRLINKFKAWFVRSPDPNYLDKFMPEQAYLDYALKECEKNPKYNRRVNPRKYTYKY